MDTLFPYAKQSISADDIQAVSVALQAPLITRGPKVQEFEEAIARYVGAEHAVAFSNGSTALKAAYTAAEMGPDDKLIATPNTFIASVGPGTEMGASPVFVDIDRNSGNMDLNHVKENLDYKTTRGKLFILPVHFSGIAVDLKALDAEIKSPKTFVIEDAAHALGSCYSDGQKVGCCAYSLMTIFSFHPVKQITTGEGGMVTTNDPEMARRLKLIRNNGIERDPSYLKGKPAPWYYEVQKISTNYNFTDFQAALGLSQLSRLDAFVDKRRRLVKRYRKNLKGLNQVKLFDEKYDALTSYHLFVAQIDFESLRLTKTEFMEKLQKKGVGSQYHYIPLYRQPCYSYVGDISSYFPEMETYYKQALSLPLYYDLQESDVDIVCDVLTKAMK